MIKAIIALINKWAYRCEHEWEKIDEGSFTRPNGTIKGRIHVYTCEKCCKSKVHRFEV